MATGDPGRGQDGLDREDDTEALYRGAEVGFRGLVSSDEWRRGMREFNLEARWVKFSERWPEAEETILARDFAGNTIGADYADDDECYVVFNGEYHIRRDELNGWEWLEVKEKGGEE